MSNQSRRILGLSIVDGSPILEPNTSASSLTIAAAGGWKTIAVSVTAIQSMLADHDRAIVINDVKDGEIASQIADMCLKNGRKFAVIDDSHVLGRDYPHRISVGAFGNVLTAHEQDSPDLLFEIENVCLTLIDEPKDDAKNKYFREVPREFIAFGILALLAHSPRLVTPGGLAALIGDPETWNSVIDIEAEEGDALTRSRALQLKELRDKDPEHYSQHYLAAQSALRVFQVGGAMHEAGRDQDISHAELLKQNYVVCLVQSQRNAQRLGAYYGLHFLSFMSAQLSGKCGKADYILDEFCNAPLRPMLNRITVMRAYGGRCHYIVQSRADIQRQYGEKDTAMLEENCTVKQWLKFSNFEEAERVSKAMGEIDNVNNNLGFNSDKMEFSGNFNTGRERLFTAEELMRLPADEQIIHVADVGFIYCKKVRQNEISPYCYDLSPNPLEGGILPPDPKVYLPTGSGGEE